MLTGMAIALCLSRGTLGNIVTFWYFRIKKVTQISRTWAVSNQKQEAYQQYPVPELHG
jgi:hypothetical protein